MNKQCPVAFKERVNYGSVPAMLLVHIDACPGPGAEIAQGCAFGAPAATEHDFLQRYASLQ